MSATTEPNTHLLQRTRDAVHPRCVICGPPSRNGLGVCFHTLGDGSVSAEFDCDFEYEGYDGMLHGGVISALSDAAMANCLFARGIAAVTAELNVRFRHPIRLGKPLTVTGTIIRDGRPVFVLQAELVQDGQLKAKATGKFMELPEDPQA
ncbi:MAG: PaaI family thioesterase [Phycisphaerae bacterium]